MFQPIIRVRVLLSLVYKFAFLPSHVHIPEKHKGRERDGDLVHYHCLPLHRSSHKTHLQPNALSFFHFTSPEEEAPAGTLQHSGNRELPMALQIIHHIRIRPSFPSGQIRPHHNPPSRVSPSHLHRVPLRRPQSTRPKRCRLLRPTQVLRCQ